MFGGGGGEFVNNVFSGNKILLEEDYFSKGQVLLQSSLVDGETTLCPSCQTAVVRFRSPNVGDYRLASATHEGNGFAMVRAVWAKAELDANGSRPPQAGIFSQLMNPSSR